MKTAQLLSLHLKDLVKMILRPIMAPIKEVFQFYTQKDFICPTCNREIDIFFAYSHVVSCHEIV